MNGIIVDKNIMTIDIITLLNLRSNNISDNTIINHISSFLQSINVLIIGKTLTISKIEKNLSFIKKIAIMFYSFQDLNIISCKLINTPSSFSSIFKFVKPLLTKNALDVIEFEAAPKSECLF
jgi:hypothetical protein